VWHSTVRKNCPKEHSEQEIGSIYFKTVRNGTASLPSRCHHGCHAAQEREGRVAMLLLIVLLVLLFGGGGGYYGYSRWGTGGGLGIVGTVLLIVFVVYLAGGLR